MFGLGHWEILALVLLVVVLFGAKKVPEIFAGLGKGIKEFKKAMREEEPQEQEQKEPQESKRD